MCSVEGFGGQVGMAEYESKNGKWVSLLQDLSGPLTHSYSLCTPNMWSCYTAGYLKGLVFRVPFFRWRNRPGVNPRKRFPQMKHLASSRARTRPQGSWIHGQCSAQDTPSFPSFLCSSQRNVVWGVAAFLKSPHPFLAPSPWLPAALEGVPLSLGIVGRWGCAQHMSSWRHFPGW